jgi:DNA-binding NtrC family response regulator
VRELENVVHRALVVSKGDALLAADLPMGMAATTPHSAASQTSSPSASAVDGSASGGTSDFAGIANKLYRMARLDPKLKVIPFLEREMVIHALKETQGNQVQAAKILGITRATLRKRIEKFSITQQLDIK